MRALGQALTTLCGIAAVGHYVAINVVTAEWFWLVVGLLFFPVVVVLWPIVAWFFGVVAGPVAAVYYAVFVAGAVMIGQGQRSEPPF